MIRNAEFDRCVDFLARMIEKYGDVVLQAMMKEDINTSSKEETGAFTLEENTRAEEYGTSA